MGEPVKQLSRTDLTGMRCSATFSDDMAHRYHLLWRWSDAPALTAWMLNPSTATHEVLDPTIAGLVKRARLWGFGGVAVVNLFGVRATDPRDMMKHHNPIGADNDTMIRLALLAAREDGTPIVCGWGRYGTHLQRQEAAFRLAKKADVPLMALQLNADGTPQHPLYIKHDVRPMLWRPA